MMKIIFIKAHVMNGIKQVVGQRAQMHKGGEELIKLGVALEYSGPMRGKTKIKLENLK